jgi:hypothetical protein
MADAACTALNTDRTMTTDSEDFPNTEMPTARRSTALSNTLVSCWLS